MRFCVWDTSSKVGSVALFESTSGEPAPACRGELTLDANAVHSERLLWAIDQLLQNAGWKIRDLDFLAVGLGPGSFTGLRIGVTTARSLAQGLEVPVVGFSSLQALGVPVAAGAGADALVIAATDAAKGELFVAWGSAETWSTTPPAEHVLTPEQMTVQLQGVLAREPAAWLVVGEAAERYPQLFEKLSGRRQAVLDGRAHYVQSAALGALVLERFLAGKAGVFADLHPNYLRASSAEQKLRAGLLPPGPTRT